ncbi:hypothetical protein BH11MYX4_BH11MYX4_41640 [soil metagenome]
MAARKKRAKAGVEWAGGLFAMPAYVTGEGEPYRPEVLVWMDASGHVIGFSTAKPGELLAAAATHLRSAMTSPLVGPPHRPDRIRVASPELAAALRETLPETIELVRAPTPEIDHVLASMRQKMADDAETEQSYLSPEVGPEAIGSLFRAAAGLFRAKPWSVVPTDESLLSVTIESLGTRDAALSVIGQMGESFGLILFSGIDDFEAYVDAADAIKRGEEPSVPPHFALNFERGAELSPALRKEIAEHRWEVAGASAYPWLVAVDGDLVARPPDAEEVTIAEAIALALPQVLEERQPLLDAWSEGAPFARTLRVTTHAGDVEVTLRAPVTPRSNREWSPHDLLGALAALDEDGDEIDHDARRALEDELVRRFVASPEATSLTDIQSCHFVMDFAADYFGMTIATLGPTELREIIFEIIPRKVSIDASQARWVIEESRAFFSFLERELGLEQAGACLRVLGRDAVKKLEAALSDRRNFGMAKSVMLAGREAGFDVETKEGIEAWMREVQGKPLPPGILPAGFPVPRAAPTKNPAKKTQRKAARNARKKNR